MLSTDLYKISDIKFNKNSF